MGSRAKLLDARTKLRAAILASEDWQPSYKEDRASFKMLTDQQAKLETAIAEYFVGLNQRVPAYVDWSKLTPTILADTSPVLNKDDDAWELEQTILTAAVLDIMAELVATGYQAGSAIYNIPMLVTSLDQEVLKAARTQVATMVSGVTDTTRNLIKESVAQSIATGEDITAATERLRKIIVNPVRAELIAHTESVNAYQTGLHNFGVATGAKTKTWDALVGACQICGPMSGKTIKVDELFVLPNGNQVPHPSAHPRCRCGVIYNY